MSTIKFRWRVSELVNVMSLYNVQKVFRSTTGPTGTFDEITGVATRVALAAGVSEYYYNDVNGALDYYYCSSYYNSSTGRESDKSTPVKAGLLTDYLSLQDLYNLVGSDRVRQYFDDDIDEAIADEQNSVNSILRSAEADAASYMMRSWGRDNIILLAQNDPAFKNHVAWVALEYASERRPEFTNEQGQGQFWAQYQRAVEYFKALSKGKQRSVGEEQAGKSPRLGGTINPPQPSPETPRFIFAPDKNAPGGHGGF